MRKSITRSSHRTTLRLVGTGEAESGSAYSPFGPVRAGLITMQRTNEDQVLTELLNSLERKIAELNIKSYEALNTLRLGINHRAEPTISSLSTTTTSVVVSKS